VALTMSLKLALGYVIVATILAVPLAGYAGMFDPWAGRAWTDLPLVSKLVGLWILVSAFGLWFWMLADFFRGRRLKHRVAVGFCLVLLSWLAAVFYFLLVYARASKQGSSSVQANSAT
jgi:hypothetical protein